MRSVGANHLLPVLLAGTLLLCHGVFGALHLVCDTPGCSAEHPPAHSGAAADAHEHPAGHETGTGYFAVVAGLLGLLIGLFPKGAPLRTGMRAQKREIAQMQGWRREWYPEG